MDDQHVTNNQLSVRAGRPTTYDASYHDTAIIDLAEQGMSRHEIAREFKRSVKTLYNWASKYESFDDAFDRAQDIYVAKLLSYAFANLSSYDDHRLNERTLDMLISRASQPPVARLPELKLCKTFTERCDCIIAAVSDARISAEQADILTNIISKSAKIEEITQMRAELDEIKKLLEKK